MFEKDNKEARKVTEAVNAWEIAIKGDNNDYFDVNMYFDDDNFVELVDIVVFGK